MEVCNLKLMSRRPSRPESLLPLKPNWFHIEADLIEESEERPDPALDDVRRRYYWLSPVGRRVLAAESARLEALVRLLRAKDAARDAEAAS